MALGIFMKGFNNLRDKKFIDFIFEFIPQIVLLLVLFGFMDFLIIVKWLTNYDLMIGAKPPSVISSMIIMSLSFGNPPAGNIDTPYIQNQIPIMQTLIIIAGITVPIMLLVKPIYELNHHKKSEHKAEKVVYDAINERESESLYSRGSFSAPNHFEIFANNPLFTPKEHKAHSFGDLFIHQMIETIEFVLGTVSNTASYLRLWALSLAHSQLAKVFFDNTVTLALKSGSFVSVSFSNKYFILLTISYSCSWATMSSSHSQYQS